MTPVKCEGTGWISSQIETHNGPVDAARPCDCRADVNGPSLLSRAQLTELAIAATEASNELGAIPEYPSDRAARDQIGKQIIAMCSSPEQVRHIVRYAVLLFSPWKKCGIPGLRLCLLSKYKARDGIQIASTEDYPDGMIPSLSPAYTDQEIQKIARGEPVSEDRQLVAEVDRLKTGKKLL